MSTTARRPEYSVTRVGYDLKVAAEELLELIEVAPTGRARRDLVRMHSRAHSIRNRYMDGRCDFTTARDVAEGAFRLIEEARAQHAARTALAVALAFTAPTEEPQR